MELLKDSVDLIHCSTYVGTPTSTMVELLPSDST